MRAHLTLILSSLLTACTGGGQTTTTPPAPATLPATPTGLNAELLTLLNEVRTHGTVQGENVIPGSCADGTFQPGQLAPLTFNPRAAYTAAAHAQYLAQVGYEAHAEYNAAHPAFTGATVQDRWNATQKLFGPQAWTLLGENVAAGQSSAAQVTREWMASPGHCRNIMEPTFTSVGVSGLTGGTGDLSAVPPRYATIWVQVFIAD